jgi:hypothetical protein
MGPQFGIGVEFTALFPVNGSNEVGYGSASNAFSRFEGALRLIRDDSRTGFGSAAEAQHPLHHGR